ncbi:hypothetical protein [Klebsiella pneumoniae]
MPDEFKPTAAELLKAHENPELLAAVEKVATRNRQAGGSGKN